MDLVVFLLQQCDYVGFVEPQLLCNFCISKENDMTAISGTPRRSSVSESRCVGWRFMGEAAIPGPPLLDFQTRPVGPFWVPVRRLGRVHNENHRSVSEHCACPTVQSTGAASPVNYSLGLSRPAQNGCHPRRTIGEPIFGLLFVHPLMLLWKLGFRE